MWPRERQAGFFFQETLVLMYKVARNRLGQLVLLLYRLRGFYPFWTRFSEGKSGSTHTFTDSTHGVWSVWRWKTTNARLLSECLKKLLEIAVYIRGSRDFRRYMYQRDTGGSKWVV